MDPTITCTSKLWLWSGGKASWHFITIPKEYYPLIKEFGMSAAGFGSVRVRVTIGTTTWKTSVFPSKEGVFLLPIKSEVRKKEKLSLDDTVTVTLSLTS